MIKRLLMVILGSLILLGLLQVTGLLHEITHWIYYRRYHDKIAHVVVGALYTLLLAWVFQPRQVKFGQIVIPIGALVMFGLAFVDELIQKPLPGRDANPLDMLASTLGIAFGLLLWNIGALVHERKLALSYQRPEEQNL